MHGYAVFDNNAYKRAGPDRLARIVAAEREQGVVGLASVAVLQALLARVRDPDASIRQQNRAAIRKLAQHCRAKRDGRIVVNFVSHADSQLYRLLSNRAHPDDKRLFDDFGDMVRIVSEAAADDDLLEISDNLTAIEQTVASVEASYIDRLQRAAAEHPEPNEMKRNFAYAAELAFRAEAMYGQQFTPEHIASRLVDAMKYTSIGFALRDSVVVEMRRSGGGHATHKNTVWDEEIVASTSMYTTINSKTLLVVTGERRLILAAARARAPDRVISLVQYEDTLGLPEYVPPPKDS
jgi:hypothetical protein